MPFTRAPSCATGPLWDEGRTINSTFPSPVFNFRRRVRDYPRGVRSPRPAKGTLDFGDALLVALVEGPLLDLLAADQPRRREDSRCSLAVGWLIPSFWAMNSPQTPSLTRSPSTAAENAPSILEPVHDLEPAVIGESLDEARINHGTNLPAGYPGVNA